MISNILPNSVQIKIGSLDIKLRLPLFAMLYIEQNGYSYDDLLKPDIDEDCLATVFAAALASGTMDISADYINTQNTNFMILDFKTFVATKESIHSNRWLDVMSTIIHNKVIDAWVKSIPKAPISETIKKHEKPTDTSSYMNTLRCLYCDVLGKSQQEFWLSTTAEIMDRWDRYAVAQGFKEPTIEVEEFDDGQEE